MRSIPGGAQLMVRLSWFKYMSSVKELCSGNSGEGDLRLVEVFEPSGDIACVELRILAEVVAGRVSDVLARILFWRRKEKEKRKVPLTLEEGTAYWPHLLKMCSCCC